MRRGFPVVVPLLAYDDLGSALEWLARVFGFCETLRFEDEHRVVRWAEMRFGRGYLMLSNPVLPLRSQRPARGAARTIVFVDDAEAHRALDPEGNVWTFSQHLADVQAAAWGAVGSSDL